MKRPFRRKKKRVGATISHDLNFSASGPATSEKQEAYASLSELEQTEKTFDRIEFLDTKRAEIAIMFVRWYITFVAIVIIGVPLFNAFAVGNNDPVDIYQLLAQLGTLLGSPLGFVVGYYFKDDHSNA